MPRLFAIGDLHLSGARPKPMDVFGPEWAEHDRRIEAAWRARVRHDDIVLVAGDISWAMRLSQAEPDLARIASWPGEKVLVRGNHDYWWEAIGKLRRLDLPSLHYLQHAPVCLGPLAVAGTRLWDLPEVCWPQEYRPLPAGVGRGRRREPADDAHLVERELSRLERSLEELPSGASVRIVLLHHPPLGSGGEPSRATEIIARHQPDLCVYGHLHALGPAPRPGADCVLQGTRYVLVSADWVDFAPVELAAW
ncbi:MAG: metallophosphoesterase [Pseudomonadota bacterium]